MRRARHPVLRETAPLFAGALAHLEGDRERAIALTREAIAALERFETHLMAQAARRQLGRLVGGDEGREMIKQADAWFGARGVRDPARMAGMLVPWR
jgi:hypothetical protein